MSRSRWYGVLGFTAGCILVSSITAVATDMHPVLWGWFLLNMGLFSIASYKIWRSSNE